VPKPHPLRAAWRRPLGVLAAGAAVTLTLALAACGGSPQATAAPAPSGSAAVRAYADCLLGHTNGGDLSGARKACKPLRPAGGLGPALQGFTACLQTHGVQPPASSGTGTGALLRYLEKVRSGDQAQRAAFNACESRL